MENSKLGDKMKIKNALNKIVVKNILYTILVFFATHIVYGLLPLKFRETFSGWIFTGLIFPILIHCFTKIKFAKSVYIILLSLSISSFIALAKPELNIVNMLSRHKVENDVITHDVDFVQQAEESDAIENIVTDIDDSVFEKFYQLSYIKNGVVKGNNNILEELKVQTISDMIISDIEQSGLTRINYSNSDLNTGTYGELTKEANQLEKSYFETKDVVSPQENISLIRKIIQKREEAYSDKKTVTLLT